MDFQFVAQKYDTRFDITDQFMKLVAHFYVALYGR